MRKARKQLSLLPGKRRKRRRRKAGQPARRRRVAHAKRPEVSPRTPLHVTLTTVPDVGRLRTRKLYQAVRRAMMCSVGWSKHRERMRICQLSIQDHHLHLIVEADSKAALSRGMQGFKISCAKQINALLTDLDGRRRRGKVFADRYHARALTTPLEVRRALAYVLCNWRHHGASVPGVRLDPYATGISFGGWLDGTDWIPPAPPDRWLMTWLARTWLLRDGWQRHGLLDAWETPGGAARPT
jgi:REP element-mobilizing transposase RayT